MGHSCLESEKTRSQLFGAVLLLFRGEKYQLTAIYRQKIVGHSYLDPPKMGYSYFVPYNTGSQLFRVKN